MKLYDQTSEVCESRHINEIYAYLNNWLDDNWGLYVRQHNQMPEEMKTSYGITIVISAEGHSYLPVEIQNPSMDGVFMHYLTKNNPVDINTYGEEQYKDFWTIVYEENNFVRTPKLFELPLGTTKWFKGTDKIPIDQRKYDVSFIGQLDPYRRSDFFTCLRQLKIDNSFIHFYEGWNKGLGPEKYSEIMSETKIALVPCGSASLDTFRFYEAMSCGCVVLSVKQNNYEFMKNSPHLKVPTWNTDIVQKYIQQLINSATLQDLSDKSRQFWETNLSPNAAAKFILNKVKN